MPDPSSLYGGYLRASRYSRVKPEDLTRALKPYQINLTSVRQRRGGNATDAALRRLATQAVVKKYQRAKAGGGRSIGVPKMLKTPPPSMAKKLQRR